MRDTRPINWLKGARRGFEDFPEGAQLEMARVLTILAEGRMPDIAKPLTGFGSGVMELALRYRGDAFRLVYAAFPAPAGMNRWFCRSAPGPPRVPRACGDEPAACH